MKKSIVILLTAAFLLCAVSASAYDIKAEIKAYTFDVTLQSDETTARPTIQLLNADKTSVLYVDEGKSTKNADGTYAFSFDEFNVPTDLTTGTYIIRVGGTGVDTVYKTVRFVNNNEKGEALERINDASTDTMSQVIHDNAVNLQLDITQYEALTDEWKGSVNDKLLDLDLANDRSVAQVEEKYKLFKATYDQQMEIATICGSHDSAAVLSGIESSQYLALDKTTYYAKLSDKKWVSDILAGETFSTSVSAAEVVNAFDGAVLTGVINQLDYGTAQEAFKYYADKGLISVSFSAYDKLSSTDKANVFKKLKTAGIKDYTALPAKLASLVSSYSSSGSGNGGGGSGGSSSSSGSKSSGVPVSPLTVNDNTQTTSAKTAAATKFSDTGNVAWAEEAINYLAEKGVVSGTGDNMFSPDNEITREAFAKMVVLAFGMYDKNAECSYGDVAADDWSYGYIASAKKNGIISGITESEFGYGLNISRQDAAVIIKRIYDLSGKSADIREAITFADADEIAAYAESAVNSLYSAGIINGTDNTHFSPQSGITRAQSAKIIYELIKSTGE